MDFRLVNSYKLPVPESGRRTETVPIVKRTARSRTLLVIAGNRNSSGTSQPVERHRLGFPNSSPSSVCFLSLLAILFGAVLVTRCAGYSVLTHEAIIDAEWDDGIKPLLLQRFPGATPEELQQAHAYAYGGAIIQDMGYYPFGSEFFSDLTHYVRSGDFVLALIAESHDLNEYAFALGALSHYAADTMGHPLATNRSVRNAVSQACEEVRARRYL